MQIAIAFTLLSIIPYEGYTNNIEILELNHFYDDQNGRLVFDQAIARNSDGRIRQWFLIKDGRPMDKTPEEVKTWEEKESKAVGIRMWYVPPFAPKSITITRAGKYYDVWIHSSGDIYRMSVRTIEHTWTTYDPELVDRELLPKELRTPLIPWDK